MKILFRLATSERDACPGVWLNKPRVTLLEKTDAPLSEGTIARASWLGVGLCANFCFSMIRFYMETFIHVLCMLSKSLSSYVHLLCWKTLFLWSCPPCPSLTIFLPHGLYRSLSCGGMGINLLKHFIKGGGLQNLSMSILVQL